MDQHGQPNVPHSVGQQLPPGYAQQQQQSGIDIPVYGQPQQQPQPPQHYAAPPHHQFLPYLAGQPFNVGGNTQQQQQQQQKQPFNVGGIPPYGAGVPYRPMQVGGGGGGGQPLPLPQHLPQQYPGQHANQFDQRNSPHQQLLNAVAGAGVPSAYAPASHLQHQQQQHQQHSPPLGGGRGLRATDDDYVPDDDDHGAAALLAQVANHAANHHAAGPAPPAAAAPLARRESTRAGGSRWTAEEDATLIEAIKETPPLTWTQIGDKLGKRSQVCGQRWYNHLAETAPHVKRVEPTGKVPRGMIYKEAGSSDSEPEQEESPEPVEKVTRGPLRRWAGADDEQLKASFAKHGGETEAAWHTIAAEIGAHRTWRACRQRWNTHHKPADEEEEEEDEGEYVEGAEPDLQVEGQELVEEEEDEEYEIEEEEDVEVDADWDEDSKGPAPSKTKKTTRLSRPKAPGVKGKHTFTPAGQSPVFLPASALVAKPPIPFTPTSVIRGRRTLAIDELKGKLFSPSGKVKKVHQCPAENCSAAFKRSEHLKRHYRSVHMGSKPFPCQMTGCTKSFSRKDNLQQHMAMVHSQRAVKLEEPLEDGTTHRYEAMEDQPVKKRAASTPGTGKARGGKGRKKKGGDDEEEEEGDGEGGETGEGTPDAEGSAAAAGDVDAEGEGEEEGVSGSAGADGPGSREASGAAIVPPENVDPSLEAAGAATPAVEGEVADPAAEAARQVEGYYASEDFLKQLQAMEASAAAAAKADVEGAAAAAAVAEAEAELGFVPPPPPSAAATAAAAAPQEAEGDLAVGPSAGEKRSREEEDGVEQGGQPGGKAPGGGGKKRRVAQSGDIAVGGEGDIEVPGVEEGQDDGSYERTRV